MCLNSSYGLCFKIFQLLCWKAIHGAIFEFYSNIFPVGAAEITGFRWRIVVWFKVLDEFVMSTKISTTIAKTKG